MQKIPSSNMGRSTLTAILLLAPLASAARPSNESAASLAGLTQLEVRVVATGVSHEIDFSEDEVAEEIQRAFRENGISIGGEFTESREGRAQFIVSIDLLDLGGEYVLYVVETRVLQHVKLDRNPLISFDSPTWWLRAQGAILKRRAPGRLSDKVGEQVESFLSDYLEFR